MQVCSDHTKLSISISNASSNSKLRSEDEATYSINSDSSFHNKDSRVDELAEDNYIPTTNLHQQEVIMVKHQENGVSEDVHNIYPDAGDGLFSDKVFSKISLLDKLKMTDDVLLDTSVHITSTDQEIEDEVSVA